MGLFKTKKDRQIEELKRENDRLRKELDVQTSKFDQILEYKKDTPDDCVEGRWCQACEFVRTFHYYDRMAFGHLSTLYICGKAESCPNFVQREVKE